jgi:sterol desaturase/sphingolipid hydroxylase (fatty acid hydroxylase superfamily)
MALSKKWQLSWLEYHVDFLIAPVLFGLAIWLAPVSVWKIILGVLIWSFAEYGVHRFLFHKHFRRDHWAHHVNAKAYIGISGIHVGVGYAVLLLPAWWLKLQSIYAGFMLGYLSYMTLHFAMHRPQSRLYRFIGSLVRNHEMHHLKGIEKNFGVTSPLWDLVFRTYVRPVPASIG